LGFIGSGVVVAAGAAWALYRHFSKQPSSETKQPVTGVQIGGSVTAGRDVVIQNIHTTPEQFDALLQKRLKEVMAQISQADPQQRAVLEKELAAIKAKHDNLQTAFEEQKVKLAEAYQALDKFKQEVPAGQIEQAQKALAQGQTGAAEKLFQQVLDKSTKEAEKRTAEAAVAAYQLGGLAESRIAYGQAESYYRQAVQLQPDNPIYLNVAGTLSQTLGHYQESEKLLKRALEIMEKSLKPDDPDVATSLNNLASLYHNQGKYGEAEPLYQRALAIYEKALGPEYTYVATALNNLAGLYQDQGKYGEAEPLYKRALAIDEKAMGPEHPLVATGLNNLAGLYYAQGKHGEAEPLYKRALAIDEKALGPEHPNVAIRLNNLAGLYYAQGKYGEAEPLCKRALAIDEKSLGPEHPYVAKCLGNYAALLKKMGRDAEAAPLEARAREIRAQHAEKNPQR
jgi:tetratricopeptide (TPR) repeat protein